ncbi:MAG TPA: hypothetical protein P5509_03375 [Bacteroidales bacterium]|nr:hypothetical protein [Bacteroidales bacterium]
MSLIFQNSFWWILLMLIISGGLAFVLYYKEKKYSDLKPYKQFIMAGLRFFTLFLILFLLFNPLIKHENEIKEKPIVIFVQDNSYSILLNKDSVFYKNEYPNIISGFIGNLRVDYDVKHLNTGVSVREDSIIDFSDKLSNFSDVFSSIEASYGGMNIGAVIFASDGIFNSGYNPVYGNAAKYPIYTIALGDTSSQKDFYIKDVRHNKLAFINNIFPVRLSVIANKCTGLETKIEVLKDDKIIHSELIVPDYDEYNQSIDFELTATDVGVNEYEVRIVPVEGEISVENNYYSFVIDVIDNRQKILFYANSPHPDIGALKYVVDNNPNFEADIYYSYSVQQPDLSNYDLIVLHQIPSLSNNATHIFNDIETLKIPVLYIFGEQSSLAAYNQVSTYLRVNYQQNSFDNALPLFNQAFTAFSIEESLFEQLPEYPPLRVAFGDYDFSVNTSTLFYQLIGRVATEKPLISFVSVGNTKYGLIMGEGIWRWRIRDYQLNQSTKNFNDLFNKIIQYLITQRIKQKLIVDTRRIISDNDNVIIKAELYNEAYELVNSPEVELQISDEEGKEYSYIMNRSSNAYTLNAGNLKAGDYGYVAKTEFDGNYYEDSGEFFVREVNLELMQTRANHSMLNMLALKNGGEMFYYSEIDDLAETIKSNDEIVTKIYKEYRLLNIINVVYLFFIILLFASIEWFLRKFWGGY